MAHPAMNLDPVLNESKIPDTIKFLPNFDGILMLPQTLDHDSGQRSGIIPKRCSWPPRCIPSLGRGGSIKNYWKS